MENSEAPKEKQNGGLIEECIAETLRTCPKSHSLKNYAKEVMFYLLFYLFVCEQDNLKSYEWYRPATVYILEDQNQTSKSLKRSKSKFICT